MKCSQKATLFTLILEVLALISYTPLFKTLESKGLNPNYLRKEGVVDGKTLAKMSKGGSVRLETIERICIFLDIPIEQVVRITKE